VNYTFLCITYTFCGVSDNSNECKNNIIVCVSGLPVSYDKHVVIHEGEPPAPVHTAAAKL
jgi:hypothetical protein